jgi:hypothetical protein
MKGGGEENFLVQQQLADTLKRVVFSWEMFL